MDKKRCLELAKGLCNIGVALIDHGGEIYYTQEALLKIAEAYHVKVEFYVVPNSITVAVIDEEGEQNLAIHHANMGTPNVKCLENLHYMIREICENPPEDIKQLTKKTKRVVEETPSYSMLIKVLGFGLGGAFFCLVCSGGWMDAVVAAVAAMASGTVNILLSKGKINFFVNLLLSCFVLALTACLCCLFIPNLYLAGIVSGAIMILVPGLAFTSFMTSMLSEDISSGLNIFAKTTLVAVGLAVGAAIAFFIFSATVGSRMHLGTSTTFPVWAQCIFAFVACAGLSPCFNVKGPLSVFLCCIGAAISQGFYAGGMKLGWSEYFSIFVASVAITAFSYICAWKRHYPITSYLVISYLPLVPGLRIFKAMTNMVDNDLAKMMEMFYQTLGIAFAIALGTLLVSTIVKFFRHKKNETVV